MLTPANTATPGVKSLSRGVSDVTPLTTSDGVGGGCVLRSGMTMGQMTSGSEICRLSVQLQQRKKKTFSCTRTTYVQYSCERQNRAHTEATSGMYQ